MSKILYYCFVALLSLLCVSSSAYAQINLNTASRILVKKALNSSSEPRFSDVGFVCDLSSNSFRKDAKYSYMSIIERISSVNNWTQLVEESMFKSSFELYNNNGERVFRTAKEGDYIKIEAVNLFSDLGFVYPDWVRIEKIKSHSQRNMTKAKFEIVVRPAMDIEKECRYGNSQGEVISHFYDERTTNSFVIELDHGVIKGNVIGEGLYVNIGKSSGGRKRALMNLGKAKSLKGNSVMSPQKILWGTFLKNLLDVGNFDCEWSTGKQYIRI